MQAQAAVHRVLALTAKVWAGLSLVPLAIGIVTGSSDFRSPSVAIAGLFASVIAFAVMVLSRTAPKWIASAVFGAVGLLILVDTVPSEVVSTYTTAFGFMTLSAIVAAFVLPTRIAMASIAMLASLAGYLTWVLVPGEPFLTVIQSPVGTLAAGMAAAAGVAALRRLAQSDDQAATIRLRASEAAASVRARLAESRSIALAIHDTVLNTLSAIALGTRDGSQPLLRSRCAQDLDQIDRVARGDGKFTALASGIDPIAELVNWSMQRAASLGIDLEIQRTHSLIDVPEPVLETLSGAIDEALLNVSKHSGRSTAVLLILGNASTVRITVSDTGSGFNENDRAMRKVTAALRKRCQPAGVMASVQSGAGRGTTVDLRWSRGSAAAGGFVEPAPTVLADVVRPLAVQVSIWLGGLCVVLAATGWSAGHATPVTFLPLLTLLALCGIAVASSGRPAAPPIIIFPVLISGAFLLPIWTAATVPSCAVVATTWWGGVGGLLLVILTTLLSDQLRWSVACISAYFVSMVAVSGMLGFPGSGGCGGQVLNILISNLGVFAALLIFRRALTKFRHSAETSLAERDFDSRQRSALAEQLTVREERVVKDLHTARSLLEDIRDGVADPLDPRIQAKAAFEARFLRSLCSIDPELGDLEHVLADAVRLCRANGAILSIGTLTAAPAVPRRTQADVEEAIVRIVTTVARGSSARVSMPQTGAGELIIVTELPSNLPDFFDLQLVTVECDYGDDHAMFLIAWEPSLPDAFESAASEPGAADGSDWPHGVGQLTFSP